jgi:predicted membrane-bound spermidine synthase
LGGFLLLPGWGLTRSTFAAAVLNLVAAAVAWRASLGLEPSTAS